MTKYRVEMFNSSDERLAIMERAYNLSLTKELNRGSTFTFSTPLKDSKIDNDIISGTNYVKLYRNGTLIFSGQIDKIEKSFTGTSFSITITCIDWFKMLGYRYASGVFTSEDAGAIAWELIDKTQAEDYGDLGITEGSIATTKDRDRTYERANIAEAIINLTEVEDGFDFDISPERLFTVYGGSKGTNKSSTVSLVLNENIRSFRVMEDYGRIENVITAIGDGNIVKTATDTPSMQSFGRREGRPLSEMNWSEADTVQDHADGRLASYKWTSYDIDLSVMLTNNYPNLDDFDIGDTIRLKANFGNLDFDQSVRIYAYTLTSSGDGEELSLTVNTILI